MNIDTSMMIGSDGKRLTPDQATIARLQKENADIKTKQAELEKLESQNLAAERKASRDTFGGVQH